MSAQLVWFKRDLRVHDHAALSHAASQGPVLCLYIIEPSYWKNPDSSQRQFVFLRECLRDLYLQLQQLGARLYVVTGEVTEVLTRLHQLLPLSAMHSHEETGNALTYARDIAVARWCAEHQVQWHEYPQFGVVRRLKSRDKWQQRWQKFMQQEQTSLHQIEALSLPWPIESWPEWSDWGLTIDQPPLRQLGGRSKGLEVLHSFLTERCTSYRGGISSPLSAPTACSRLSPYLSWGCLSMREVVQATALARAGISDNAPAARGLQGFISRLHWHCHFIQKLESEPPIEWRNMHRGYDGLREHDWRQQHFEALINARTGWPLVDACVTMLRETGWLNFRMRAMLVSVAAYPLWLHWKPVGDWLAQQFIDYEPGIHWSQMQMQSGTTGINATRVYNPIKQAQDHDPHGHFVRRWLPVMRKVPDTWLFEPWKMPPDVQRHCGVAVGTDWPIPPVILEEATRNAKTLLHGRRANAEVRSGKKEILEKHGSRARMRHSKSSRSGKKTKEDTVHTQSSFDF